ncbi:sensor histidine kinase [Bacillus sp. Bva_UNVM-123]
MGLLLADVLFSKDFAENAVPTKKSTVSVPNPWSSYNIEETALSNIGYATYRLMIELPDHEVGTVKSIYIPAIPSSYILWIDGEEKAAIGEIGKSHHTMEPGNSQQTVSFIVQSNKVELIIQASNFFQRNGGLFEPILIGSSEAITQYKEKGIFFDSIVIASLLLMGIYHLTLFAFRKKEFQFLFFGIVCIVVGIRNLIVFRGLTLFIFPNLSWQVADKIEYLGATFGIIFFALFSYTQFKEDMSRKILNIIIIVFSSYSVFILLMPSIIFLKVTIILEILSLLTFLYFFYVYITVLNRKRALAFLNGVAVSMLTIAVVNDILLSNNLIGTIELSPIGLLFFMIAQAIILSKKYSMSFLETEKLSNDLAILNTSLEQQIQERTEELQLINHELQIANQKLNDAHQSRSKWLRNISHEIASPLTSIRSYTKGMLDGVIKSDKNYLQLVYDQSLYLSRMLNDLRDMTEMENNQILFHMEKVDIRKFMHELYNKYKLETEKQDISFLYKDLLPLQEREYYVLIDTIRIEQVMVNLLKNAQRFVDKKGIIMLELDINDEKVMIRVKDNGKGIQENELPYVFERFYKGRIQGKPHNGSGLGLPISKEIVDYHQGEFSVNSIFGKGTCFSFTLPLKINKDDLA